MAIYSESEGYGSREKPYKTLSEAIDACEGTGKMVFVDGEEQKEKTYTLAEIKAAFQKPADVIVDEYSVSYESVWKDFLKDLEKAEKEHR